MIILIVPIWVFSTFFRIPSDVVSQNIWINQPCPDALGPLHRCVSATSCLTSFRNPNTHTPRCGPEKQGFCCSVIHSHSPPRCGIRLPRMVPSIVYNNNIAVRKKKDSHILESRKKLVREELDPDSIQELESIRDSDGSMEPKASELIGSEEIIRSNEEERGKRMRRSKTLHSNLNTRIDGRAYGNNNSPKPSWSGAEKTSIHELKPISKIHSHTVKNRASMTKKIQPEISTYENGVEIPSSQKKTNVEYSNFSEVAKSVNEKTHFPNSRNLETVGKKNRQLRSAHTKDSEFPTSVNLSTRNNFETHQSGIKNISAFFRDIDDNTQEALSDGNGKKENLLEISKQLLRISQESELQRKLFTETVTKYEGNTEPPLDAKYRASPVIQQVVDHLNNIQFIDTDHKNPSTSNSSIKEQYGNSSLKLNYSPQFLENYFHNDSESKAEQKNINERDIMQAHYRHFHSNREKPAANNKKTTAFSNSIKTLMKPNNKTELNLNFKSTDSINPNLKNEVLKKSVKDDSDDTDRNYKSTDSINPNLENEVLKKSAKDDSDDTDLNYKSTDSINPNLKNEVLKKSAKDDSDDTDLNFKSTDSINPNLKNEVLKKSAKDDSDDTDLNFKSSDSINPNLKNEVLKKSAKDDSDDTDLNYKSTDSINPNLKNEVLKKSAKDDSDDTDLNFKSTDSINPNLKNEVLKKSAKDDSDDTDLNFKSSDSINPNLKNEVLKKSAKDDSDDTDLNYKSTDSINPNLKNEVLKKSVKDDSDDTTTKSGNITLNLIDDPSSNISDHLSIEYESSDEDLDYIVYDHHGNDFKTPKKSSNHKERKLSNQTQFESKPNDNESIVLNSEAMDHIVYDHHKSIGNNFKTPKKSSKHKERNLSNQTQFESKPNDNESIALNSEAMDYIVYDHHKSIGNDFKTPKESSKHKERKLSNQTQFESKPNDNESIALNSESMDHIVYDHHKSIGNDFKTPKKSSNHKERNLSNQTQFESKPNDNESIALNSEAMDYIVYDHHKSIGNDFKTPKESSNHKERNLSNQTQFESKPNDNESIALNSESMDHIVYDHHKSIGNDFKTPKKSSKHKERNLSNQTQFESKPNDNESIALNPEAMNETFQFRKHHGINNFANLLLSRARKRYPKTKPVAPRNEPTQPILQATTSFPIIRASLRSDVIIPGLPTTVLDTTTKIPASNDLVTVTPTSNDNLKITTVTTFDEKDYKQRRRDSNTPDTESETAKNGADGDDASSTANQLSDTASNDTEFADMTMEIISRQKQRFDFDDKLMSMPAYSEEKDSVSGMKRLYRKRLFRKGKYMISHLYDETRVLKAKLNENTTTSNETFDQESSPEANNQTLKSEVPAMYRSYRTKYLNLNDQFPNKPRGNVFPRQQCNCIAANHNQENFRQKPVYQRAPTYDDPYFYQRTEQMNSYQLAHQIASNNYRSFNGRIALSPQLRVLPSQRMNNYNYIPESYKLKGRNYNINLETLQYRNAETPLQVFPKQYCNCDEYRQLAAYQKRPTYRQELQPVPYPNFQSRTRYMNPSLNQNLLTNFRSSNVENVPLRSGAPHSYRNIAYSKYEIPKSFNSIGISHNGQENPGLVQLVKDYKSEINEKSNELHNRPGMNIRLIENVKAIPTNLKSNQHDFSGNVTIKTETPQMEQDDAKIHNESKNLVKTYEDVNMFDHNLLDDVSSLEGGDIEIEGPEEQNEENLKNGESEDGTEKEDDPNNGGEYAEQAPIRESKPEFTIGGKIESIPWPWMVGIYSVPSMRFICGGTLIDYQHVLSAAHCFYQDNGALDEYAVVIGQLSRIKKHTPLKDFYRVEKVYVHEKFTPDCFCHDIAVLRLRKVLGPEYTPICLPHRDTAGPGENGTVLGWGDTKYSKAEDSSTQRLQRLDDVILYPGNECRNIISRIAGKKLPHNFADYYICAGVPDGSKDACVGDSGGPLMHEDYDGLWSLVGVVSFGYKCGNPGTPGTYARVSYFIPWIMYHIQHKP